MSRAVGRSVPAALRSDRLTLRVGEHGFGRLVHGRQPLRGEGDIAIQLLEIALEARY